VTGDAAPSIRIDKWLWHARFLKSRSLASKFVTSGNVRIDGERCEKPSRSVKPGDTLTFPLGPYTRLIRILDIGTRRGPAPEAQGLYEDLAPPETQPKLDDTRVGPRPTKRDRRIIDQFRDQ